jgi:hypothetical protein
MRRPRMTTRRWTVFVAIVGVLLGGLILKRRSDYFRARADEFAERERACAALAIDLEGRAKALEETPDPILDLVFSLGMATNRGRLSRSAFDLARMRACTEACAELKRAFLRAANRPWESGPAEPPPATWQE